MNTPERRRLRHEQINLMSIEERRDVGPAEILAVSVLCLLREDGKVREVEPGVPRRRRRERDDGGIRPATGVQLPSGPADAFGVARGGDFSDLDVEVIDLLRSWEEAEISVAFFAVACVSRRHKPAFWCSAT